MANFENQTQLLKEMKPKIASSDSLPGDIIQSIFTFLPIKHAIVIATTVSPRYKRSWCHNRRFLFDRDLCFRYSQQNLAAIVDHLFNSHEGDKIQMFQLHIDPIGIEVLLNRWLQICTKKDLEDLELGLYQPGFTIESNVFNALHKLKTLKLAQCVIQLPDVPTGLQLLQTLKLANIHITEKMFGMLIEHCKMLEMIVLINCSTIKKLKLITGENNHFKNLRITYCDDLEEIEIDSPTLRSIFYRGKFPVVRIAQGMQLYDALFCFTPSKEYMQSTQLEALAKDFSHLSILTTTPQLIEGMAVRIRDGVFREAQYCFVNLRELQLFMDGAIFCNPYDITMFLKNCPSLVKLFIDLQNYKFYLGMYWELHHKLQLDRCNHKFTQLKVAVVRSFKFLPSELELLKIILQRATILEKVFLILPESGRTEFRIQDVPKYAKLINSWKASAKAIVHVHESNYDESFGNPTHSKLWILDPF